MVKHKLKVVYLPDVFPPNPVLPERCQACKHRNQETCMRTDHGLERNIGNCEYFVTDVTDVTAKTTKKGRRQLPKYMSLAKESRAGA